MKTAKPVSYGRSCQTCKVYFITSDPMVYTCPWCSKAVGGASLVGRESSLEDVPFGMLAREE